MKKSELIKTNEEINIFNESWYTDDNEVKLKDEILLL